MDISNTPRLAQATVGLACLYLVYRSYLWLTIGRRRQAFQLQKGTLEAPWFPQREHIVGWDILSSTIAAVKEHRALASIALRFGQMKVTTFQVTTLGRHIWLTIEPSNLKTMQATEFKKWRLPKGRDDFLTPLLGDGKSGLAVLLCYQTLIA